MKDSIEETVKLKVREFKMNCFRQKFFGKELKQKIIFHSVYVRLLLLPAGYNIFWPLVL